MPTTNYGWPIVAATATVDVPRDINALANAADASLKTVDNKAVAAQGKFLSGLSTARPAVVVGALFFETDTNRIMIGVSVAAVNYWVPLPGTAVLAVRQTVQQIGIADNTFTPVTFDTVDWNPFGNAWTASTRAVPKFPGRYMFTGGIGISSNATGFRAAAWIKNGGTVSGATACVAPVNGTGTAVVARPLVWAMNGTTDYMELHVKIDNGSTTLSVQSDFQSTMHLTYLGP